MRPALLTLGALLVAAPPAPATDLPRLLAAVAANAAFPTPARADVHLERRQGGTVTATARLVLLGRGHTVYLEVQGGERALIRPAKVVVAQAGRRPRRAAPGTALTGSDIALEDLAVFTAGALRVPQVSDDGPAGVVVTGAPAAASSYVLLVHTIDPDQDVAVRTQYYRESIGNLVKIRRDAGLRQVGSHWRPGEIALENLREATSTTLGLAWQETPELPVALFSPDGLTRPSGLSWPAP